MNQMAFGAADQWNAMLYGEANRGTLNYLSNQFDAAKSFVTSAGASFVNKAYDLFQRAHSSEALDFARSVISKIDNRYMTNRIQCLTTLEQLRGASPTMQRWIMVEPTIRQRLAMQTCEGYLDTLTVLNVDQVGEACDDWRHVMNGMVQGADEDDWKFVQYSTCLESDQRELTFLEKADIVATWAAVKGYADDGIDDPTSPSGGSF